MKIWLVLLIRGETAFITVAGHLSEQGCREDLQNYLDAQAIIKAHFRGGHDMEDATFKMRIAALTMSSSIELTHLDIMNAAFTYQWLRIGD